MIIFFKKYHKWFSLVATLFILLFAVSGIILNHRKELSGVDVSRKLLPGNYTYRNWNLAAIRGFLASGADTILLFGNIGVWRTDSAFRTFQDMNAGFPPGIDNRKISSLCQSSSGGLYAGTFFGLFRWEGHLWQKVTLPVESPRIVRVLATGDSLWVMTRSELFLATADSGFGNFRRIALPAGENDDGKAGLFKTLWVIHSGEIYGLPGKLIVDAVGLVFIVLCITGLIYFFMPGILKRVRSEPRRAILKKFNRGSLRWHNIVGSWAILILLLNTATGMFLRPPLLIPIANERVGKLKYTELDDPNPWFDRLRDMLYEKETGRFMVATSEGIYYAYDGFRAPLKFFPVQPPVSVMGINVFREISPGRYLVGSFSGLYEWSPDSGEIRDAVTGIPHRPSAGGGPPFGSISVAGMVNGPGYSTVIFDYAMGVMAWKGENFMPPMPSQITDTSPISLWNACLEIHTGRIFEPVLGMFYILVVPVVGLITLFILISGFFAWWLPKTKKMVNSLPRRDKPSLP